MKRDWQLQKQKIFEEAAKASATGVAAAVAVTLLGGVPEHLASRMKPIQFKPLSLRTIATILMIRIRQESSPGAIELVLQKIDSSSDGKVDLDRQDSGGRTVLMYAAQNGYTVVVQEMLKRGASPSVRDHERKTALNHARAAGYADIVRLLDDGTEWREIRSYFMDGIPADKARPPVRLVLKKNLPPKP